MDTEILDTMRKVFLCSLESKTFKMRCYYDDVNICSLSLSCMTELNLLFHVDTAKPRPISIVPGPSLFAHTSQFLYSNRSSLPNSVH